jgi:pyruvate-ferredoxin/flavodoxin oxidoreductase
MTGKYEPAIHDAGIAAIGWNDLTDEEKHFVPPIILVGSRARLAGNALNGLIHLLDSDWPVKIMVLDDAAPEPETAAAEIIAGTAALLSASFLQKVQVLKGSLAAPEQLFAGLSAAFHQHTPALVWVYVPEPSKHSIAPEAWPKLNALSLNSRAFPLFRFKPDREGALFSAKTDLDGNPQSDSLWNQSSLSYQADGEEKTAGYSLSWADWAFTLAAWKDEFVAHPDGVGTPVPLTEFLALPETARTGKVPVIYRIAADSGLKKYRVSEKVVAATEACQKAWQLMREIAGELSEFPEKIHKKVSTELSEKYKLEAAGLKAEYEARISKLEAEFLEKIRIRLTDKLVSLSRSKEN